jgi:hypothetical protein
VAIRKELALIGLLLGALSAGCDEKRVPDQQDAAPSARPSDPEAPAVPRDREGLIGKLENCEIHHHGFVLDLGTGAALPHRGFGAGPFDDVTDGEREGASVARVTATKLSYQIPIDEARDETEVSVRLYPGAARSVTAVLGERRLGTVKLAPGPLRIVTFPVIKAPIPAGRVALGLRFSGRPRGSTDPVAELDWIRVGAPDDSPGTYAAPTHRDLIADVALDSVPRRALALRAPGSVRCRALVSEDAELRTDLGYWGDGKGAVDVRVLTDGADPVVLAERGVSGGSGATWTPLTVPLAAHAGKVVAVELRALETTRGGRVLFGDPAIVRTADAPRAPEASTVVVFVSSGTDRSVVPPWGPVAGLSALGELARGSAAFSTYRVPSTVPAAVFASLLTAEQPAVHTVEDPAARLPKATRTLAELLEEASGRTAMFTAVPTTFAAFGFEAGWDKFAQVSPVADVAATEPIAAASRWLEEELGAADGGRRLLVIHARGAHPPWDVTREEAGALAPEEYAGALEPRRGGLILSRLRTQRRGIKRRLDDADWARLRALVHASLTKQDAALGQLIGVLKKKGRWDSTLFVFLGDVAPGAPPETPFDPAGELTEDRLLVPLLVKFPGGKLAAKEVQAPVTSVDVAATVLRALGVQAPSGSDLFAVANGRGPLTGRAFVASLGDRYSTRVGSWLLRGRLGKTPTLCQMDVDPACVNDVFDAKPIAGWAAWQRTSEDLTRGFARRQLQREPASIDPDTGAALTVWGDI